MRSTYANTIVAIIAAVAAAPALFAAGTSPEEVMEPRVSRYSGILPKAVCQELIRLGEETGFNVIEESIDDHQENPMPSQSIEVLSYGEGNPNEVINQPIWDALQPYLKTFADLVKKTRKEEHLQLYPDEPDREPWLDWIFFRKYSPTSDRNSLIPHVDTNVFTLNIALNDDFEGGGLFYVKPPMQDLPNDGRPELKPEMNTYEWANTVKKENTSELVFPDMHAGDVLIHNFTVWHGVAPLDKGERYSFVLFYDMDNPIIDDLDDIKDPSTLSVEFYHEIEDVKIVLAFVKELNGTETLETVIDDFPPYEAQEWDSFEGHKFRAIVEDTGEVLTDIVVSSEKNRYVLKKLTTDSRDGQGEKLIEPRVSRYSGILPQAVCKELIRLGEETGFNVISESIDENEENPMPSQSIEVLSYGEGMPNEVINQPIWDALQPYLKTFADLVKKTRKEEHLQLYPDEPDREPELDWIFFRKYAPTSDRNSLIPHVDTNVFTLNIALNDDFEGGGLFYVKPPMQDVSKAEDGRPNVKPEMTTYEWANTVKKENTSELVFPDMHAGDVLIHNFTVWHGVAPLDKGERYSFVLFYDMDNPIIADLDDSDTLPVEFYHEIEDVKVVLVFVEDFKDGTETLETVIDDFPPYEAQYLDSFEGHKFRAIVENTGEVLADIVVSSEKKRYVIPKPASDSRDEL